MPSTAITAWFLPYAPSLGQLFLDNIAYCRMFKSFKPRVAVAKTEISPVTIALQLNSGESLTTEFPPQGDCSSSMLVMFD